MEFHQIQDYDLPTIGIDLPPVPQSIQERLDLLAQVAELLDIDDLAFSSYAAAITRISSDILQSKRSLNRLQLAEQDLLIHLASTRHDLHLITKWQSQMDHEQKTGESAASIERKREAMVKKAREYQKELEVLMGDLPEAPSVSVTDLLQLQESNKRREKELKAKRAKIKAFQGLPPNLELARNELRRARNEQIKLVQLRERLLGRMAESVI